MRTNTRKSLLVALNILVVLTFASNSISKTIVVDGDKSDWGDISPKIIDPVDPHQYEDLLSVKITNDETYVYFLLEYANPVYVYGRRIGNYSLELDTDMNSNTGCDMQRPGELGSEIWITFSQHIGKDFVGDGRDCGVSLPEDEFINVLSVGNVEGISFLEFSVPIATLRILSPNMTGFFMLVANDDADIGTFTLFDNDDDGIEDYYDNCPQIPNYSQEDSDEDCIGDVCDSDPFYPNYPNSRCGRGLPWLMLLLD